eukprot:TRINITY_DN16432_c0_g2_i2.p1 TRINITY_DN16432_c0_g2~~TRINITY_DN16432_c0_g2_i2.p1  ORF type:complete len:150 (-),score=25.56 TRINITY_DN16432_c0_g2_i2:104-553(-)
MCIRDRLSDIHIMALLKLFEWKGVTSIPFASSLVFELYNHTNSRGRSTLKVAAFYNGGRLELRDGLEDYETFIGFVNALKLKDDEDFMRNCLLELKAFPELSHKNKEGETMFPVLIILLTLSFFLLVAYAAYKCLLRKRNVYTKAKQSE